MTSNRAASTCILAHATVYSVSPICFMSTAFFMHLAKPAGMEGARILLGFSRAANGQKIVR